MKKQPSIDQSASYSDFPLSSYPADKYLTASPSGYEADFFSKIPLKGYEKASPSNDQSASYSDFTSSGYGATL